MKITMKPPTKQTLDKYQAMSTAELDSAMRALSPSVCETVIYKKGIPCVPVFATGMYATELICQILREMTGARLDWHYVGGRVNMLLHPDDKALQKEVSRAAELMGITSLNEPDQNTLYGRIFSIRML